MVITWEFDRNANSWAPPNPTDSETLGTENPKLRGRENVQGCVVNCH